MSEANQIGGVEVNNVAMPSQVAIMHKQFQEKKELLKEKKMRELIDRYGGEKHLALPDEVKESLVAAREEAMEIMN